MAQQEMAVLVQRQAAKYGDRTALKYRDYGTGTWVPVSWKDFERTVRTAASALVALGVQEGENVGIFSQNKPECLAVDFAAFANRAVTIPLYATSSALQVQYIVGDAANLPSQDFSLACLPLDTDDEAEYVIMTGNRDVAACPDDSVAMVWNKVEEYSDGSQPHSWMYCNERNNHELPRLSNLTVVAYGDVLLAVGGRGQGTSTAAAFSQAYVSEDNGLTWHKNGSYYLPEGFTNGGSDVFALAVDDDDYMWLVAGGTGDVWRGRLNRLGWEDWQTSFTE